MATSTAITNTQPSNPSPIIQVIIATFPCCASYGGRRFHPCGTSWRIAASHAAWLGTQSSQGISYAHETQDCHRHRRRKRNRQGNRPRVCPRRRESVHAGVAETVRHFGRLDLLASNAGIRYIAPSAALAVETGERSWRSTWTVRSSSPARACARWRKAAGAAA